MRKGIYRNGKIYYQTETKEIKTINVINQNDWWTSFNQEVLFEVVGDKALIQQLGKIISSDIATLVYG
jgi:hypothetical protein